MKLTPRQSRVLQVAGVLLGTILIFLAITAVTTTSKNIKYQYVDPVISTTKKPIDLPQPQTSTLNPKRYHIRTIQVSLNSTQTPLLYPEVPQGCIPFSTDDHLTGTLIWMYCSAD